MSLLYRRLFLPVQSTVVIAYFFRTVTDAENHSH